MNKKQQSIAAGVSLLFLALLIFIFARNKNSVNEKNVENPESVNLNEHIAEADLEREEHTNQRAERLDELKKILTTPIAINGLVVDQFGSPIQGATVTFSIRDKLSWDSPEKKEMLSSESGRFYIQGAGGSVYINVKHDDYYPKFGESKTFSYKNEGSAIESSPDDPATFILRGKGEAEPLVKSRSVIQMPKNGTPVEIDLLSGKKVGLGKGDVVLRVWTGVANPDNKFDWKYSLSVPRGGLIERIDQYNFIAPIEGYVAEDAMEMSVENTEKWLSQISKEYFISLSDGTFARLRLRVIPHGDHFVVVESHFNPSGSRNLEYDPALAVKP